MFSKTIDSKREFINADGSAMIDLTESIFNKNVAMSQICSVVKLSSEYEMRPDLVSKTLYGSTDYTEMILKYSLIPNPFCVDAGDFIYNVSLPYIYNPVVDITEAETKSYNFVKNYHKYIDKNKIPSSAGSEKDTTEITSSAVEPNISKTGTSGITIKNGKVYFGPSVGETADDNAATGTSTNNCECLDASLVDCAESGVTLGEFLNATVKNYNS